MRNQVVIDQIKSYPDFEAAFDETISQIVATFTPEHLFTVTSTGETIDGITLGNGSRVIANESRKYDRSLGIFFENDGRVKVTVPERGRPGAWVTYHTVHDALARAVIGAISVAAGNYARNTGATDQAEARRRELVRLLRLLDDEWAEEAERGGHFGGPQR